MVDSETGVNLGGASQPIRGQLSGASPARPKAAIIVGIYSTENRINLAYFKKVDIIQPKYVFFMRSLLLPAFIGQ